MSRNLEESISSFIYLPIETLLSNPRANYPGPYQALGVSTLLFAWVCIFVYFRRPLYLFSVGWIHLYYWLLYVCTKYTAWCHYFHVFSESFILFWIYRIVAVLYVYALRYFSFNVWYYIYINMLLPIGSNCCVETSKEDVIHR